MTIAQDLIDVEKSITQLSEMVEHLTREIKFQSGRIDKLEKKLKDSKKGK